MRWRIFCTRNIKELVRDPLNGIFGLGFPLVVLFLLSAIQANIPVSLFEITTLTPGIAVFGLSFLTLFSATLLAKDRESAFLWRLYTTPLTAWEFISGYVVPIVPLAWAQSAVCYVVALPLGLPVTPRLITAVVCNIPAALFFISLGLLCGSLLGVKQVGGLCGALVTNLTAWLSGIWFDLALVGGAFERLAGLLPFVHAVKLEQAALQGTVAEALPHLAWVMGYAVITFLLAVFVFTRQMKKQ